MIRGIHHAAISTPDIDKAIEFYCGLLGFEQLMKAGWPKGVKMLDDLVGLKDSASQVAMLKKGNAYLELFQYESPVPKEADPNRPVNDHGFTHICLDVTDLDGEYERLKAAGMHFHCAPIDMPGEKTVYGRDPFGNVLELQEVKNPDSPSALRYAE
jgi:catechol 2,3-dioxygenase-like lactoylglutathione lyase family enzyme